MKRNIISKVVFVPLILILLVAVCTLTAQQYLGLTMRGVMTSNEFSKSGIGSLSAPQRAALDDWLNRYTARVVQVATTASAPTSTTVQSRCNPTIETTIDGEFNGWEGETIFKLSNGQIWQQAEYSYTYSYAYMPEATIYQTTSGCKLRVEDEDETILVKRIK